MKWASWLEFLLKVVFLSLSNLALSPLLQLLFPLNFNEQGLFGQSCQSFDHRESCKVLDLQVRTVQSESHTHWCDQKLHQKQACEQNRTLAGAIKIAPRVLNLRVRMYLMTGRIPAKATRHLKSLLVTRYPIGNKKREARR
jgi:hypothetical protein